jgi:hypothetical protein
VPLFKITIPGLSAIACAVVLLWACLLGERISMRRALEQRTSVIRAMQQLHKPSAPPVSMPEVGSHNSRRPIDT